MGHSHNDYDLEIVIRQEILPNAYIWYITLHFQTYYDGNKDTKLQLLFNNIYYNTTIQFL